MSRFAQDRLRRAFTSLALCAGASLWAQHAGAQAALRPIGAVQGGLAVYGSGDEANCPTLPALAFGAEARTPGRLFVSLSAHLLQSLGFACTDMLLIVPYADGRMAEETGGTYFLFTPRLAAWTGAGAEAGRLHLEAAAGTGWLNSVGMDDDARRWQPWLGASLVVRPAEARWAMVLEHGAHRVRIRHAVFDRFDDRRVAAEQRELHRWKPMTQLGVRFTR
jgi:hypothetical protein